MGGACSRACGFFRGQRVGGLSPAERQEQLHERQVREDNELEAEIPFERWTDLTPEQRARYLTQHERHLEEFNELLRAIRAGH